MWTRPGDFHAGWIDGMSLHRFQRLRCLLGANAPTTHAELDRVISHALHRHVSKDECMYLLEEVGMVTGLDVRDVRPEMFYRRRA